MLRFVFVFLFSINVFAKTTNSSCHIGFSATLDGLEQTWNIEFDDHTKARVTWLGWDGQPGENLATAIDLTQDQFKFEIVKEKPIQGRFNYVEQTRNGELNLKELYIGSLAIRSLPDFDEQKCVADCKNRSVNGNPLCQDICDQQKIKWPEYQENFNEVVFFVISDNDGGESYSGMISKICLP